MRAPDPTAIARSYGPPIVVGAAAASAVLAFMPGLSVQLMLVATTAGATASVAMTKLGRVLNPSWVIVIGIYLIGPIGTVLVGAGLGGSTAVVLTVAPAPFVLGALIVHRQLWRRLLLLTPLLALLMLAGLSLLWSPDVAYGTSKLTTWIVTSLVPVAFILLLVPEAHAVGWRLIALAAFLYAVDLLIFGANTDLYPGRLVIFTANPIWEARAVFLGAVIVLFGPFSNLVRLISVPVMVLAGLVTVSLGPALGLVVGIWAGAGEILRAADRRDRRVGLGWAIFGLTTGLGIVLFIADTFGPGTPILATLGSDPNISSRASYLGTAAALFAQSPLLGIGLGGFAVTGLDTYPHNMLAEILSELGVVGMLIFIPWVVLAIRGAMGSPILMALVATTSVYLLFSGSLASNVEFFMFTALAVARVPLGRRSEARNASPASATAAALVASTGATAHGHAAARSAP